MAGHQFLKKEFDFVPKIGWNLGAYGHSDTNARLFHEMGFDAQFLAKADEDDKNHIKSQQTSTFLWRPSSRNFGNQHQILSYLLTKNCFPEGFQADEFYEADDNIVTDETLSTFNAHDLMVDFVNFLQKETSYRKG